MNGSLKKVPELASFAVSACITSCWRLPRETSLSRAFSLFSRTRE